MKKNTFGRQFKRDHNERKALFNGLMNQLILHERIQTTEQKAKAIKGSVEKLVTKAKIKGMQAVPQLLPHLSEEAVKKLVNDISPRFKNRPGGYTRLIRLGQRFGDNASVVIMEWTEVGTNFKNRIKSEKADNKPEKLEAKAGLATEEKSEPTRKKKRDKKSQTETQKSKTVTKKKTEKKGDK